jgi:hypothetical protein
MFTLGIEMYGIPQNITRQYKMAVDLQDEASLKDVVLALKRQIPALEGPVICPGQDRLNEEYTFIVNGQSQPGESNIRIQRNDRIVLVLMATGG